MTSIHPHKRLCGGRFDAGLINDLIIVKALSRAQGEERIPDKERFQSWTTCDGFLSTYCITLSLSSVWTCLSLSPSLSHSALISGSDQQDAAGVTANVEEESSDLCRFCARCSSFIRKQQCFLYLDWVGLLMKLSEWTSKKKSPSNFRGTDTV